MGGMGGSEETGAGRANDISKTAKTGACSDAAKVAAEGGSVTGGHVGGAHQGGGGGDGGGERRGDVTAWATCSHCGAVRDPDAGAGRDRPRRAGFPEQGRGRCAPLRRECVVSNACRI